MTPRVVDNSTRPLRKLCRLTKSFPADPSPEEVHALRTQTRRMEAVLDAVTLDSGKQPRRLRHIMTPVRKAAGGVRDMDVMIRNVLTLSKKDSPGSVMRLVAQLAQKREKRARYLRDNIAAHGKEARMLLKRYARLIERQSDTNHHIFTKNTGALQALIAELERWPELDSENLHAFRIRVKKLQYLLQISHLANRRATKTLAEVKDAIGDWHDWRGVLKVAEKVLDPKVDRAILNHVQVICDTRLRQAFASASLLREREPGWIVGEVQEKNQR
jgi:CHAD domain-containing protein